MADSNNIKIIFESHICIQLTIIIIVVIIIAVTSIIRAGSALIAVTPAMVLWAVYTLLNPAPGLQC